VFRKVLIANRGEIAVRIARALREMEIASVAVYSDVDRASLHVRRCDEAVHIGAAPSRESYLHIERILEAARRTGAEAIHPGYGFLSENADFAAACEAASIVFIGPPSDAIRKMGSKTAARRIAAAAGTPIVPGAEEGLRDAGEAARVARECGYPVMLKAVAGGGGKGMRRVDTPGDLAMAFETASSEAAGAFGDAAVYIEKLIEQPRHIEIQIIGDQHGNMLHLGERECSIQRRHQKVLEECPSALMTHMPELRERMGQAAISAARAAGYYNAGTVEFLVDARGAFYFLEMNTRLQVEHPVTELVTGVDLVRWQIEIAAGGRLPLRQEQVRWNGAAIECRVYAEDPEQGFFPSPGRITHLTEPAGPGVRLDSGVYSGWHVPLEYDPMLAKLAVWAETRNAAAQRAIRALGEYHVGGIETNLRLFPGILRDPAFREGRLHTGFLDEYMARRRAPVITEEAAAVAAQAALAGAAPPAPAIGETRRESGWRRSGRESLLR
jgi:acetyl-CoA carboxylase biotin carboxylase subunit